MTSESTAAAQNANNTTLIRRALRYGIILTIAVVVIGGLIGFLAGGVLGLISALIAAAATAIFMGLTAVSFLVAGRVGQLPEGIAVYYGVILGTFLLKFVIFIVLVIWLRGQHWLNPSIFGLTLIVAVLGTLIADVVALQRGRVPYVNVALPGEKTPISGSDGGHPVKSPKDS